MSHRSAAASYDEGFELPFVPPFVLSFELPSLPLFDETSDDVEFDCAKMRFAFLREQVCYCRADFLFDELVAVVGIDAQGYFERVREAGLTAS